METGRWRLAGSRKRLYTFAAVAGGSRSAPSPARWNPRCKAL